MLLFSETEEFQQPGCPAIEGGDPPANFLAHFRYDGVSGRGPLMWGCSQPAYRGRGPTASVERCGTSISHPKTSSLA
jgi:hypothetical protein